MVVDHSHRLHVGVADGWADEAETTLLQITAQRVRLRRAGRDLGHRLPVVAPWQAADKTPLVMVEAAELFLNLQKGAGVLDRRLDLQAIAHDVRVLKKPSKLHLI